MRVTDYLKSLDESNCSDRIALCIPTYNRPDVIDELLARSLKILVNIGYDIYLFDSSEDDKTEALIEAYSKYSAHVSYRRIASDMHSNIKAFEIYKDKEINDKYQYIWLCTDAVRFSEDAYQRIYDELGEVYDFVVPDPRDKGMLNTQTYTDYRKAFLDFGWHTQLFGAVIVNTDTVLKKINWETYEKKWLIPQRINYSHVGLYFDSMAELKSERIRHLSINPDDYSSSPLREKNGWYSLQFLFMCELWPNVINALPDCYNEFKVAVIKAGCEKSGVLEENNLYNLKKEGLFNIGIVLKYWKKWKYLTDISRINLLKISIPFFNMNGTDYENKIRIMEEDVHIFKRKYPLIYIYGAGYIGNLIGGYFEKWGIEYEGYLVSDISLEKKRLRDKEIFLYDKNVLANSGCGCILGLNKKYANDVLSKLAADGYKDNVYVSFLSKDSENQ